MRSVCPLGTLGSRTMIALRLARSLLLWATVAVLWGAAYAHSVNAVTLDRRLIWCLPPLLAVHALGLLLAARLGRRRGGPLSLDDHGLALIVTALATLAASHITPYTSIRVLREEVAPIFAWVPLLAAFAGPVLLTLGRGRLDLADRALVLALLFMPLSGALFLVEGPAALCLAGVALLMALEAAGGRLPRARVLVLAGLTLGLLLLTAHVGPDRLQAAPAVPWIAAWTALLLALAARPRSGADWRLLLAMPVASATLLALCGVVLTAYLTDQISWESARDTRLTLFRQHPNFLAPCFAYHAVLALGLAVSGRRGRPLALLAAALLAASTWHTDSRAGLALLVLGVLGVPALLVLLRLGGDRRPRLLATLVLAAPVLGLGIAALVGSTLLPDQWTAGIGRFEKSLDYRLDAWRNSLTLVTQNPWLGIGPRTFLSVERFAPGSRFFNAPESPHPHNVLLYLAQSGGWAALALFLTWLGALLAGLLAPPPDGRARTLQVVLAAGLLALIAANLLDVGLALDSVVPEPIFLMTGLVAALWTRSGGARLAPGPALIVAGLVLWPVAAWGLLPTLASTHLERAEIAAYQAGQRSDNHTLWDNARAHARAAIELDADLEPAYALLSRWLEGTGGGTDAARDVLLTLRERAPRHGPTHSRLAHLYLRSHMDTEGVDELRTALNDSQGSVHLTRDLAELIMALARLGRRDEAMDTLVQALSRNVGVIDALNWRQHKDHGRELLAGASDDPIRLADAIEILFGNYVRQSTAGQEVGRRAWMDLVSAFRRAARDDRALAVLAHVHAHVPAVERHSIANERGRMALAANDHAAAAEWFDEALALTGNPFFAMQAQRARGFLAGAQAHAGDARPTALTAMGEILDQPEAFEAELTQRAERAEREQRPYDAARLWRRILLFEDDTLLRARQLQRCAELSLAAGEPDAAAQAVADALWHLDAKPFPRELLTEGLVGSGPRRLAQLAAAAWSTQELGAEQRLARAWNMPGFFHATPAACLFRMSFFSENGQPDAQLREAEMALLINARDPSALWSRLEALEALGRHSQAESAMRNIAEQMGVGSGARLERMFAQVLEHGRERLDDWNAWFEAALVRLIQGRYAEAADLMGEAVTLHTGSDDERARLLAWHARAELFSSRPSSLRTTHQLLQEAAGLAPHVGSIRLRLETLP